MAPYESCVIIIIAIIVGELIYRFYLQHTQGSKFTNTIQELNQKFANGEISEEEFDRLSKTIIFGDGNEYS